LQLSGQSHLLGHDPCHFKHPGLSKCVRSFSYKNAIYLQLSRFAMGILFQPCPVATVNSRMHPPEIDCRSPGPDNTFWRAHFDPHCSASLSMARSISILWPGPGISSMSGASSRVSRQYSKSPIRSSVICQDFLRSSANLPARSAATTS